MALLSLNSSISSLVAQRHLADHTRSLTKIFDQLSSGLRIVRAGDDAAGLSIAAGLKTDVRVFTQGVRNLNDAIGMLNIAEGAVNQFGTITTRLSELAEQSANGTLSVTRRKAIQQEADALVNEYNRIASSTSYNGLNLLDTSLSNFSVQSGYGASGTTTFSLGAFFAQNIPDGGSTIVGMAAGPTPGQATAGDINGDGIVDLITTLYGGTSVATFIGNGDGTFKARTFYGVSGNPADIALADFNGDGRLDILSTSPASTQSNVLLGNGDGSFRAPIVQTSPAGTYFDVADINRDGRQDLVITSPAVDRVGVMYGNGDGTFRAQGVSYAAGDNPLSVQVADFDGNGIADLVTVSSLDNAMNVLYGNIDGSFRAAVSFAVAGAPNRVDIGDLNRDGIMDALVTAQGNDTINVLIGNADGSFKAATAISAGTGDVNPTAPTIADANNDGYKDIIYANTNDGYLSYLAGNGDGTFRARISFASATGPTDIVARDFNGDGVLDFAVPAGGGTSLNIVTQTTTLSPTLPLLSLLTQDDALASLDLMTTARSRIAKELGNIGAIQSRLNYAANSLSQSANEQTSAQSRIEDVDVATAAADLTKQQILQNIARAILAQANNQGSIVLDLLR